MNTDKDLFTKKIIEQSKISYNKDIIIFGKFLNLNEQSILHSTKEQLMSDFLLFGGYNFAERQMVAFIPDDLYDLSIFPIMLLNITITNTKYSQKITHRDVLGALMSLGIKRDVIGDIIVHENDRNTYIYIFCDNNIGQYIIDNLNEIKRTKVQVQQVIDNPSNIDDLKPVFKIVNELIPSNRIDVIVSKAFHLSRDLSKKLILSQKVFINGRIVNKTSEECKDDIIVSVRGYGRFIFKQSNQVSKKGKLKVIFKFYE
ncbi:YlmH/Sll1252 family protein [Lachnobacterium bovis]|uniref:YlmH/Sll1252 family protein n=1 Tax=Lachnobacterium bovis TaxID=140626 RepID=UPI000490D9C1|nr:YlmH/Sll1252 family protein [Lachnobacterium bovis]